MRGKFVTQFLLSISVFAVATAAHAFPLTSTRWSVPMQIPGFLYEQGFNYEGVVAMSNCSASLVRFKSSQDSDLAMVLTNGHCVGGGSHGGMLEPGEVLHNFAKKFRVELLNKDAKGIKKLNSTRILYAAMTGTDVALLELDETYAQIAQSVATQPLTFADQISPMGADIDVASGYWKRTYTCKTEVIVPTLKEADWTFKNSIRYSPKGCETIGGTSGSPIISKSTGEIIGINNTGNEDGESCTMNNPCEVDADGKTHAMKGRSYGQQTYLFYGCLGTGNERIDLGKPGCELAK
jgi:V8-like Glu-specific endopeptidase